LANLKSSKKDIVSSRRRRVRNSSWKSACKTLVRKARTAVGSGDAVVATELVREASRQLDKTASKGIIHPRQAARRKSRIARQLAKLSAAPQA
jgi:small subunit ribosomal protein S20